ncbi:MAG TPA: ComF family protein [Xanthomonadales bacterium]|nr:ComF family protein [Xanthomonadales bacterium]
MTTGAKVDGRAGRALRVLLPLRCLLCGAPGARGRDLCEGCARDLARNEICCPRCALPLKTPAPLCGECVEREPPFASAWVPFRYAHPLDLLEARFKFRGDLAAGRVLAGLLIERVSLEPPGRPDAIVTVPLHVSRLRERGYNQAFELAKPLARSLGIPIERDLLQRVRATPAQTGLDAASRRRNLRRAFAVDTNRPLPAHVALFDDVMTTGATLRECARTLRRAGVARVDVWALARAPQPRG